MIEIIALLSCLDQCMKPTTLHQLVRIVPAILAMPGCVTMLGISRWTGEGGSYRTIQRFYTTVIPWATVLWVFFRQRLWNPQDTYLAVGDEDKAARQAKKQAKPRRDPAQPKGRPGRQAGSKNRDKTQIEWTTELRILDRLLCKLLALILHVLEVRYLVLDGQFGNNNALQVVQQSGALHLISKLRHDAALYFRYDGPYSGCGPRRKYGDKILWHAIPDQHLMKTTSEQGIRTDIYQTVALHRCFAQPLNVVTPALAVRCKCHRQDQPANPGPGPCHLVQ